MSRTPQEVTAEILSRLDIAAEYAALGVELKGQPRGSGMVSCRAFGREDRRPSAWVNVKTGYYGDSGGKGAEAYTCSLWDFAVRAGRFSDWKEARKAYADKAGVKLGRGRPAKGQADWRERLLLQPWDSPGNKNLAQMWCIHKPGITLEAIKAAGGRMAAYPCYRNKETKKLTPTRNSRQVVAFPCYGSWLLDADPAAWQIFACSGQPFDVTPKDAAPSDERVTAKTLSIGPTSGTLCGLSSLMMLCDPEQREKVTIVWRVEGVPDLLTLWSSIPEDQRERVGVITSAAGATSEIQPHQTKLLAGLHVAVVGDCDEAGQVGAERWARALQESSASVRLVQLPYEIKPSAGEDIRDYLVGE